MSSASPAQSGQQQAATSGTRDPPRGIRKKFAYSASSTELVEDGYMSFKDAQTVLYATIAAWGVSDTKDSTIEPFISKIAHALRKGTSAERDYENVKFQHVGMWCSLGVLRLEAGRFDRSENPIRVWARSYNTGEIAARIYDMLADPQNTSLRQEAALDYSCTLDIVEVSFDIADALVKFDGVELSQVQRFVVKANTTKKVRTSRSVFIGGSEGGSMQDAAASVASVEMGSTQPVSQLQPSIAAGSSRGRAGFAPLR